MSSLQSQPTSVPRGRIASWLAGKRKIAALRMTDCTFCRTTFAMGNNYMQSDAKRLATALTCSVWFSPDCEFSLIHPRFLESAGTPVVSRSGSGARSTSLQSRTEELADRSPSRTAHRSRGPNRLASRRCQVRRSLSPARKRREDACSLSGLRRTTPRAIALPAQARPR